MDNYDVVICHACGFVYADGIPSQADFNDYYAAMSKYEFNDSDGVVSNDYIKYYTKVVRFLIPYINNKKARILDLGCSTGGLLSIFKLYGYSNLLGVDPSPTCARVVKELYSIDAIAKNISNFDTNEKFDLVILTGVMEHLVDFSSLMPRIKSLLNDHGLLFIEIPDLGRFDRFISAPFQQFSIEHINYFSQGSIKNLLSRFSFEIVKMQQGANKINMTTDPDLFILSKNTSGYDSRISRDNNCELAVIKYISKCLKVDLKLKKNINGKLSDLEKVIVWGSGTHTLRILGSGLDISKVLYFVDSNLRYVGKKLNGIIIKSPEDIKENNPILISTFSYQKEIIHQIKNTLKLKNKIIKLY
jgi:hypothetical protein